MKYWILLLATLLACSTANPIAEAGPGVFARKDRPKGCAVKPYNCLLNYGGLPYVSSYCSEFLPITTVTKPNKTVTETS